MSEDEKDFEEWDRSLTFHILWTGSVEITPLRKEAFLAGRSTLREKQAQAVKEWKGLPPINTTGGQGSGPI